MGGVMAHVFRHQIELNMKSQLMSDLRLYDPDNSESAVSLAWDRTQSTLQCCGIKTVQVWCSLMSYIFGDWFHS